MKIATRTISIAALALVIGTTIAVAIAAKIVAPVNAAAAVLTTLAARQDVSPPLAELAVLAGKTQTTEAIRADCSQRSSGCGASPPDEESEESARVRSYTTRPVEPQAAAVEQTSQGARPPIPMIESFDGHGFGMVGPHGTGRGGNPSDNSLAVGPDHIYETVNSLTAVYTKKGELFDTTGKVLFGPIGHNVVWNGFGGECERSPNGDTVVRYDQLADRWLIVMPRFNRAQTPPNAPPGTVMPYGMCYAVSTGPNPLGPYYRYYFERTLFPDYPRPAIWPDGYYIPTSTGDNLLPDGRLPEKHACVVERDKMLHGLVAREQCLIIPESNFLNNADIDGKGLPPAGAPNLMLASGGTQLRNNFRDDGIYVYKFYVDWENQARTHVEGPTRITVAPYNYLCDGQLTRCVPQRDTENRLDSQGDKIMQRLIYRNIDGIESIIAVHSVNTAAGGGGVRWYEFRVNPVRDLVLHQHGTFAPDSNYRWMASPVMDRRGNIGFGYSFGGRGHYPGQRFVARLADDPHGKMGFHETIMIEGQGSQQGTNLRWQDYTTAAMDPTDDCTMWYQGDYYKTNAPSYTVRIASFRVPGCRGGTVSGSVFFDGNRNGMRDANEQGLPSWRISYTPVRAPGLAQAEGRILQPPSGAVNTDAAGDFRISLPADSAWFTPRYTVSAANPATANWVHVGKGTGYWSGGTVVMANNSYTTTLRDRDDVTRLDFGMVCMIANTGGAPASFWMGSEGRALLAANDPAAQPAAEPGRGARGGGGGGQGRGRGGPPAWRPLVNNTRYLVNANASRFAVPGNVPFDSAYAIFRNWLATPNPGPRQSLSIQLAVASLNVLLGRQAGNVNVNDPTANEWVPVNTLLTRISTLLSAGTARGTAPLTAARTALVALNNNSARVTPSTSEGCNAAPGRSDR